MNLDATPPDPVPRLAERCQLWLAGSGSNVDRLAALDRLLRSLAEQPEPVLGALLEFLGERLPARPVCRLMMIRRWLLEARRRGEGKHGRDDGGTASG